jgi:hypothetical protein
MPIAMTICWHYGYLLLEGLCKPFNNSSTGIFNPSATLINVSLNND